MFKVLFLMLLFSVWFCSLLYMLYISLELIFSFQGHASFLSLIRNHLEIHGTVSIGDDNKRDIVPPFVINHGIMGGEELHRLLRQTKVSAGIWQNFCICCDTEVSNNQSWPFPTVFPFTQEPLTNGVTTSSNPAFFWEFVSESYIWAWISSGKCPVSSHHNCGHCINISKIFLSIEQQSKKKINQLQSGHNQDFF